MSNKLIVLVEDDVNLRQSFALILQRAGYIVTPTDCVHKAMEFLRTRTYHLIISDTNLPETKKVLIPKILASYPNLSLVILTDQSLLDKEKEGRLLSAHYLIKPVAPERLLDMVGFLLGRKNKSSHHNVNSFLW